jgi:capsular exopolysaccharide synthesis family protein
VASLLTSIDEKQSEISALAQRYKPKHPKYAAAMAQLESMKGRLPEAALTAASVMNAALQSAKETEERVANEAKGQEKDTYSLGKMQVEYDSIKRDIETDKTLFNSVLARLKETDITKSLDQSMIKVVEPAVASYVPVRPDKQKMLAQWSLGGLALGLMLTIGLHLMDSSFKTVDDAERALQLPVLSAVTVRKTTAKKNPIPDLETIHQKHSPVSESFRTLRSALILLGNADRRHIIMFTSAVPAEGKTFCAANFAVTMANQGLKTVLIDCDLRKPSIAEIFIDKAHHLGVADQLAGQCELDEVVRSTPVPNLDVIPAGSPSPNPSELLSGQSFVKLLTELRNRYEKIVIDSAPVLAVSDPLVIAPHVDTICLVVRSHKTSRHSAIRACAAIAKTGRMPSGIVLNRLPISAAGYYYYYGSRYGQKKVYGAPG